ncbi:MAG: DUF551 domain-containing protein [Oscillospiraceae bacterium]|nr:DUF551 domain-containing protein [Oscillospiraceae bacterium]
MDEYARCGECYCFPVCADDDFPIGMTCEEMKQTVRVVKKHLADDGKTIQQWIKPSDKLPEEGIEVLCWYEYYHWDQEKMLPEYGIGYVFNGRWCGEASTGLYAKVLYWTPIPLPPKEVHVDASDGQAGDL